MQATLLVETINSDAFTVFRIMLQVCVAFFFFEKTVIKTIFSYAAFIMTAEREIQK